MMRAGWQTVWTSNNTVEEWPSHDVIEHTHNFTCLCNPKVEALVDTDTGTFIWKTTHNTFDEFLDEDQTEPYKGL